MLRWLYAPPTARLMGEVLAALVLSLTTLIIKPALAFPRRSKAICLTVSTITAGLAGDVLTVIVVAMCSAASPNHRGCNS
jgi:hypothetical protein